jgi:hypothetical protein
MKLTKSTISKKGMERLRNKMALRGIAFKSLLEIKKILYKLVDELIDNKII